MDYTKVKAIVLKSKDYKENDKIVTLFSLENGVFDVVLKGVKKQNSKFKFAKEQFCFADFLLTEGLNPVVTGVTLIEQFYEIAIDYDKYVVANNIAKLILEKLKTNLAEPMLFLELLKFLKALINFKQNYTILQIKFVLSFLKIMGYQIDLKHCSNCRSVFFDEAYVDLRSLNFYCTLCKKDGCVAVSSPIISVLKLISNLDYEKLFSVKIADSLMSDSLSVVNDFLLIL